MEAGGVLPPFSSAVAATPRRTDGALKSERLQKEPTEQGGTARNAAERRQIAGSRGASPCSYRGRGPK